MVLRKDSEDTMSKNTGSQGSKAPMTPPAAARVQSATAKVNGGQVAKGSFAARAQAAAAKNSVAPTSKGK